MTIKSRDERGAPERPGLGGHEALAALFSRHRERLWRMVDFRLDPKLRGRVDPDDVLQEAYLAAARRVDACRADTEVKRFVWLRLIVLQTMVDIYRRHVDARKRGADREVPLADGGYSQSTSLSMTLQLVGSLTSPSQAAARAETFRIVEEALDQMDAIDREVLALRHHEELSNSEVAEALGIQQKAASIRYFRAIRRLKEILAKVPGMTDEAPHA